MRGTVQFSFCLLLVHLLMTCIGSEPGAVKARNKRKIGKSPLSSLLNILRGLLNKGVSFTLRMLERIGNEDFSIYKGGTAGDIAFSSLFWDEGLFLFLTTVPSVLMCMGMVIMELLNRYRRNKKWIIKILY